MTWNDIFKSFLSMLVSMSGTAVIVFALSSWLGKIWSERILNEHKAKLEKEIEEVKKKHIAEIETFKSEMEKVRNDYHRFSNRKFEIIDETWSAMLDITDELKIYKNNEIYKNFLLNSIATIGKYLKIIRKNSLFFNNETRELLLKYISNCSDITTTASEKIKNIPDGNEEWKSILSEVFKKAIEREKILDEIRIKFQKELGNN